MIVLNKQAHGLHDIDNSALQLAAAFAVCVAACAAAGEAPFAVSEGSIAPMLTLGLVNTGFGCYLYFSSIGKLSAQSVAVCDYLEPLSAVVLAGAFLGESLTATQTLGAALIICGALGSELGGKPRKPRYLNRSATNPQQETAHRTAKTKETKQD